MEDDLWGEIAIDGKLELPIAILKRQAELLETKTGGVLQAHVHPMKMTGKDSVGYSFDIVAPALSNYVHKVLTISHPGILLYPVRLVSHVTDKDASCKDEEDFVKALKEVLSSDVVHKAVLALITQSRAANAA